MPKFKVKTPVRKDGTDFAPGDIIDLSAKEAFAMGSDVVQPAPQAESQTSGNGNDLAKMTKAEIVAFALQTLGLQLDMATTKEDMLAAIAAKKAQ